ncbi:hypothetical protein AQPE_3417 [Aquipluma nitroreducens]|uniref:Uncharacterized protein n=1 Tax=Aquipluma nitroreducens TaxID=2010828 RepID=A0A5K7SCB1_9BACT|nr:hypothetical protein AQPE_3417 [Aquipluma nitroreducens]
MTYFYRFGQNHTCGQPTFSDLPKTTDVDNRITFTFANY